MFHNICPKGSSTVVMQMSCFTSMWILSPYCSFSVSRAGETVLDVATGQDPYVLDSVTGQDPYIRSRQLQHITNFTTPPPPSPPAQCPCSCSSPPALSSAARGAARSGSLQG
eukprot:GHUV01023043.1.p2 GENE.GHUV01023043.1~~GHUV01023043.1.p2  ORF type:complete len:112 (-),score=8.32 GHUV01023043.1:123-458(-)